MLGLVLVAVIGRAAWAEQKVLLFNQEYRSAYVVFTPVDQWGLYDTWYSTQYNATEYPEDHKRPRPAHPITPQGILDFAVPDWVTTVRVGDTDSLAGEPPTTGVQSNPHIQQTLKIWPNPSSGAVTVEATEGGVYRLYNVRGQTVAKVRLYEGRNLLLRLDVPSGVYYFRMGALWGRMVRVR